MSLRFFSTDDEMRSTTVTPVKGVCPTGPRSSSRWKLRTQKGSTTSAPQLRDETLHVTAHPHPRFLPDVALKQTMVVLVPNFPTFGYRYSSTRCEKVHSDRIRAILLDHLGEQVLQLG